MNKKQGGSNQSKRAGVQGDTAARRGSRGSRGGEGLNTPAASGCSAQTPLGDCVEDVSKGLRGGNGGIAVEEAGTSRMQIPKSGICTSWIGEGSMDERVDSHKQSHSVVALWFWLGVHPPEEAVEGLGRVGYGGL